MEEFTREEIDFLERTLRNYFYLEKHADDMMRIAFFMEDQIAEERKAAGITYDTVSGTYNNTDTPYINLLILEQASYELEANRAKEAARDLNKRNKISKRLSSITKEQLSTIYNLCKYGKTQARYALEKGVSRQAMNDRFETALKKMLEVE